MLSFNPGPSTLSQETQGEIIKLASQGLLSASHRSSEFLAICEKAVKGMYDVMKIPSDYHILFQPSATASMECVLRNLIRKKSYHVTHGAFSQRFLSTAQELCLETEVLDTPWNEIPAWENIELARDVEALLITHNETSTGLMWPEAVMKSLKERFSDRLIIYDITSSFASMPFDWTLGDVWFFSIQKCLGLPSGLACIIFSQRAYEKSNDATGVAAWQSFSKMVDKMQLYQTVETPNMFAIALLANRLESFDLLNLHKQLKESAELWRTSDLPWKYYIRDADWQSLTVFNYLVDEAPSWIEFARRHSVILGSGYGKLKEFCLRVANFPNITTYDIQKTIELLKAFR